MLEEIIPGHLMEKGFGASTSIMINIAFFSMFVFGMYMSDDPNDLGKSKFWMIIYSV